MNWKLLNREFSRVWRRAKTYTTREIRYLAQKRGLTVTTRDDTMLVHHGKTLVARFEPVRPVDADGGLDVRA